MVGPIDVLCPIIETDIMATAFFSWDLPFSSIERGKRDIDGRMFFLGGQSLAAQYGCQTCPQDLGC